MKVELQPTLIGPNVVIRPTLATDWQGMLAAASDPLIWALHPETERYKEAVFRDFFDDAIRSAAAFTIVHRESGETIGSSRFHDYDPSTRQIEIGWTFLTRAFWGGKFNREVKFLMLEHAFQFVDTVIFKIGIANWRSRRATEKIGAVIVDQHLNCDQPGHDLDNVTYAIRKKEFLAATVGRG